MRVLVVHNYYQQAGGEDAVVSAETALLRRHGHEVVEYTEHNREIDHMARLGVASRAIWSRPSRQRLRGMLEDKAFDVAHFHNTFPLVSPSAYYACQGAGVPVVQTLHNYRLLCPSATFFRDGRVCEDCLGKSVPWPGVRHACYRASRHQTAVVTAMLTVHSWLRTWESQVALYVALTEFGRSKFIEGNLPAERIVVKPNFVDPDPGVQRGRGTHALFVGRLSPEKGLRTLAGAWRTLRGIPLAIVGDGPSRPELESLIREHGLEASLELLGHRNREEVMASMRGARFLIFPSESYESFGLSVVEAFACGLPVIASRLGAMAEIVDDGVTGLHFTPGNTEDLAAKVTWAWQHPEQMQQMGRAARSVYEARYTADRNYQRLMDIYQMAVSGQTFLCRGGTA